MRYISLVFLTIIVIRAIIAANNVHANIFNMLTSGTVEAPNILSGPCPEPPSKGHMASPCTAC